MGIIPLLLSVKLICDSILEFYFCISEIIVLEDEYHTIYDGYAWLDLSIIAAAKL